MENLIILNSQARYFFHFRARTTATIAAPNMRMTRPSRIIGKPIGLGTGMLDVFVNALPPKKRREIFEDQAEKEQLKKMLNVIYTDPYIAGIGSHLQVVAVKKIGKE